MNGKAKEIGSGIWIWIVVALVFLFTASDGGAMIIPVLLLIVVVAQRVLFHMRKAKAKAEDRVCAGKELTLNHNHQQRTYSPQDIQNRDEQRRYEQLDSFLKNGIIDKKEYLELKSRYEKKQ